MPFRRRRHPHERRPPGSDDQSPRIVGRGRPHDAPGGRIGGFCPSRALPSRPRCPWPVWTSLGKLVAQVSRSRPEHLPTEMVDKNMGKCPTLRVPSYGRRRAASRTHAPTPRPLHRVVSQSGARLFPAATAQKATTRDPLRAARSCRMEPCSQDLSSHKIGDFREAIGREGCCLSIVSPCPSSRRHTSRLRRLSHLCPCRSVAQGQGFNSTTTGGGVLRTEDPLCQNIRKLRATPDSQSTPEERDTP